MAHSVDIYLQQFHGLALKKLKEMRKVLRMALPDAEECISYGMPAYRMTKVLVYFAGNKEHVGFYPTSSGIKKFEHELGEWKYSKGAIQFPYERSLPRDLITRIAIMRKEEVELAVKKTCKVKENPAISSHYESSIQRMEKHLRESGLAKPALRALIDHNILTIKDLKQLDEAILQDMHGIGPKALIILQRLLKKYS